MRGRSFSRMMLVACALGVTNARVAATQATPKQAQPDTEPMKALKFLVGAWQGKVTYEPGGDEPQEVLWTVDVRYNLGGNILLIDERGNDITDRARTTRGIVVAVYWDAAAKDYRGRLHWSADGGAGSVEGKASVQDSTFVLQTNSGTAINRFTIRVNPNGQWNEIGEISRDNGESWKRTFVMSLTRQN